jgi:ribosomal protein S18 acetylase RimI-like enzyme
MRPARRTSSSTSWRRSAVTRGWRRRWRHCDEHHLVAEEDGEVVGYVCFGPTPLTDGVWDLYWLVCETSRRSRGIGRTVLESVEHSAAADGRMVLVETSSQPAYAASRAFYCRNGSEEVARLPDFYRAGDDKIVYRKLLR